MKHKLPLLVILAAFFVKPSAAQVTWADNIAPLIFKNCTYCHNAHGIAPFELMNYNDAVQNSQDIVDAISNKTMPPWPPDPNYNHLAYERILTSQEISDITSWVNNGMLRGDSTQEPVPPVYSQSAQLSNPDLILSAPIYNVNTGNNDLYRCFVIPTNLSTDVYLTAIEGLPGNMSIVHHILIYSDTTGIPTLLDNLDPDPGYTNIAGTGSFNSKLIGAWVPGQRPYYTPAGMGIRIPAHANIVMQIHYPEGVVNQTDSTKLYLKMTTMPLRPIDIETPLNHYQLDNGPLSIPANQVKTFTAHYVVPAAVSALSVGPHMHLVGKSIRSYGVTPTYDTIPFIDVPEWNFHWQGYYAFRNVIKIPAGTTLYSSATYDNTTANPNNPNTPPHLVTLGESTTDEMMLVYFSYTTYQPGDELITIDSTLLTSTQEMKSSIVSTLQLYDISPNPASSNIAFQYYVQNNEPVKLCILDVQGKPVYGKDFNQPAGFTTVSLPVNELPPGIYFLKLENKNIIRVKKFVKN